MMGALTRDYGTDKKKELEGIDVELAVNDDGTIASIRIRTMGETNKQFQAKHAALGRKLIGKKGKSIDLQRKAFMEAFCKTCIVDWKNIENINEVPEGQTKEPYMPFTVDNAIKLFTALPYVFDKIVGEASEYANFQADEAEDTAKN